ncbi:hypothetical protein [Streptomyces buecherae]|uniref:Uncharacterized protein n=1 Tax=Streptomyces buecherae TaxID=2763006 RepID=A0A7H8N3A6_9ACTN|nr:hypothetical protein [Streptomyces buecherae]QKW48869.1 hypothetical protein HUT08_04170 [Streptomyces buecherae]
MDLLDVWRGRLSLRRIHILIQSLLKKPGRSAFLAAVDESASWSVGDHLAARVVDAAEVANYLFLKANSEESANVELPKSVPRPGRHEADSSDTASPTFADGDELSAFFTHMNTL